MKTRIKADIEKLHEEIQRLKDDESRRMMDGLLADLEGQLADEDDDKPEIQEQLEEAVTYFEAEYPRVAGILRNILTTLGNMGI